MRTNSDYLSKGHVLFVCRDVLELLHSCPLGGRGGGGRGSGSLVVIYSLRRTWFGCVGLSYVISFARLVLQWGRMCSYIYVDTAVDLCQGQEWQSFLEWWYSMPLWKVPS